MIFVTRKKKTINEKTFYVNDIGKKKTNKTNIK